MPRHTFPVRDYDPGSHETVPVLIQPDLTRLGVSFSRAEWLDPAARVAVRVDLSLDNGVTWSPLPSGEANWPWGRFPIQFTATGGALTGKEGTPITDSGFAVDLPQRASTTRRLRASVTVSGAAVRTAITLETI